MYSDFLPPFFHYNDFEEAFELKNQYDPNLVTLIIHKLLKNRRRCVPRICDRHAPYRCPALLTSPNFQFSITL